MSLKKFNLLLVLVSLSIMAGMHLYLATLLEENIEKQVHNNVHTASVELRHNLLNNFNTLQQRFSLYEELSLQKLHEVEKKISLNPSDEELIELSNAINTNVYDGHYELYLINSDKIVSHSTSKADVGLDYKEYPYFSKELDQLRSGGIDYKISAPTFDEYALDIAQYYVVSFDNDQWLMISFVLPFSEYVNYKTEQLQEIFPALKNLELYILTYDNVQLINTEAKTSKSLSTSMKEKAEYVSSMMQDLKLQESRYRTNIERLAVHFTEHQMQISDINDISLVYMLVESSLENTSDDFMLLAKVSFDKNIYRQEYTPLKSVMYTFILLVYLFMIFGFILMYKAIIQKISGIEKQMHSDELIKLDGFLFSEFSYFIERYNTFLQRWRDEVERLSKITMQDELTQCANRRYFDQKMKAQIDLFERYEQPFSLIMFDIDNFKNINDTYGHSTGDHVLSIMAADVKKQLRASDVLCRIGGEEFAIILPETERESALVVAEKVRSVVANASYVEHERVTISLGVEQFMASQSFDTFYKIVDSYLYISKKSGKNRVSSKAV